MVPACSILDKETLVVAGSHHTVILEGITQLIWLGSLGFCTQPAMACHQDAPITEISPPLTMARCIRCFAR